MCIKSQDLTSQVQDLNPFSLRVFTGATTCLVLSYALDPEAMFSLGETDRKHTGTRQANKQLQTASAWLCGLEKVT